MQVQWSAPSNGGWYNLNTVNLESKYFNNRHGVYVIFTNIYTVDVGLGEIGSRLIAHRRQFENRDDYMKLKVTWASVSTGYQGGVENYLRQQLNPRAGQRFSNDPPIPVNLPW